MNLIKFLVILIPCLNSFAAPDWVPKDKAEAFDRIIADAKRLQNILQAPYESSCVVSNDTAIVTIKRFDLILQQSIQSMPLEDCKAEEGLITLKAKPIETEDSCGIFCRMTIIFTHTSVFTAGVVTGRLTK